MKTLMRLWAWIVSWFKPKVEPKPIETPEEFHRRQLVELARCVRQRQWDAIADSPRHISAEEAQRLLAEMQQEPAPTGRVSRSATFAVAMEPFDPKKQTEVAPPRQPLTLKVER